MKKLFITISLLSIALAGCSNEEEPSAASVAAKESVATSETSAEKAMDESMVEAKTGTSLVDKGAETVKQAVETAKAKVAEIDFSNLSWDKVAEVPYDNKLQLASWATGQADGLKDQLMEAAKGQGLSMLSNLGDSGWQGALKKVVDSIDAVRESSPETYELARGALISAWGNFEKQASSLLKK